MALSIIRNFYYSFVVPAKKVPAKKKEDSLSASLRIHQDWTNSSRHTVSIVHPNPNGSSSVVNHSFADECDLQDVPGATGYKLLTKKTEPVVDDKRLLKPIRKGTASLEKVCQLLQRSPSYSHPHPHYDATETHPVVTIGDGAFIFCPGLEDEQKDLSMIQIYTKVQLRYNNGLSSTQYYHPYSSAIKPTHLTNPGPFRRIDINSGICLFSKASLGVEPGNTQIISDDEKTVIPLLPHNIQPTLYELESIMRLSSAMADTVALVRQSNHSSESVISVNIDIPDFQYYWTACELFENGLVDLEYTRAWIAAIDKRRSQLGNIMTTMIRSMIGERQVDDIAINITPGTEPVVELIKSKLDSGETPSMEEIVSALKSQGPDAARWRGMFDNMDPRDHPTNMIDLGRIAYVFKVVRAALERENDKSDCNRKNLVIQVDNIAEWRILMRSKDFLKRYFKSLPKGVEEDILIGLFPMERIFLAGSNRSELYSNDTNTGLCLDEQKVTISPLDIVSATYGLHMGKLLQLLCRREGFK